MKKNLQLLWLAIPAAAGFYILYSLLHYSLSPPGNNPGFEWLGTNRIPGFYDMKWILSYSACKGDLRELLTTNAMCFGYSNPQYPVLSMQLGRWLGLGPTDAHWLGLVFGVSVMAILAHALWLFTTSIRTWSIALGLLWLSFPFQFLLERGNLDSIIFILMGLFSLVVWLPGTWSVLFANAIAGLSIALKMYPAIGFLAWLIYLPKALMTNQRKWWLVLSLALTVPVALVLSSLSLFSIITQGYGGMLSHGLTAIGYANMFLLNEFGPQLGRLSIWALYVLKALSIFIGLAYGLTCLKSAKNLCWPRSYHHNTAHGSLLLNYVQTFVLITSAVGIGCYIASIGYDYRLIFILPLLGFVLANLQDHSTLPRSSRLFLSLLVVASAAIFILPFGSGMDVRTLRYLELIDECVLAPFLFSGLGAVWIHLFQTLPQVNSLPQEIAHPRPLQSPAHNRRGCHPCGFGEHGE